MTAGDRFLGAWRVSEYVYDPDRRFAGLIRQRRVLEALEGGRTRVTQTNVPVGLPAGHPMCGFAGTWVFELEKQDAARRYLGPDVVGGAIAHGDRAMSGRGLWPRFGHTFRSYAILEGPIQITGGTFANAQSPVARIFGVAAPEQVGQDAWPEFSGPTWPGDLARTWRGTLEAYAPGDATRRIADLTRTYSAPGSPSGAQVAFEAFEELENGDRALALAFAPSPAALGGLGPAGGPAHALSGRRGAEAVLGTAQRFGWALEFELVVGPSTTVEALEVLIALPGAPARVVGLRRVVRDEAWIRTEVLRLEPVLDRSKKAG